MNRSFAEKVLDDAAFQAGSIRLTPSEVTALALPAHPEAILVRHDEEKLYISWESRKRALGGEALLELLELYGRVGGLLRLHRDEAEAHHLVLQFLDRPTTGLVRTGVIDPRAAVQRKTELSATSERAKPKRATRKKVVSAQNRHRIRTRKEFDWHGGVGIGRASVESLTASIISGGWDSSDHYELRVRGEELGCVSGFDELLALDQATVDHMPHQEATALKVLAHMRGRAVLADEVGLGKTIEAGLVVKELIVRGMAKRILIVCPATLREQWQSELREKFHEDFDVIFRGTDPFSDRMILSLQMATRQLNRLVSEQWDVVILDEAHRITGPGAKKRQQLFQQLKSRFALYLTATPVQNDLLDLYRLIDTLRPGTFTSQRDFRTRFMGADPREPSDPAALRRLIADVMVRTTRAQAGIDTVNRIPVDHPVTLSPAERKAYELCLTTLRSHMNGPGDHLRRRQLAHRLTTSPRALGNTARRVAKSHENPKVREILDELADLCADFGVTARQKKLIDLVKDWVTDPDKGRVLVFTQHTDTLEDIMRVLDVEGIEAVPYHGGMSPKAKQASIKRFAAKAPRGAPVMVSTESGAEGLNLQFANCVVNYDLPWNPMRIEQRIGRVHRVTQKRDVYVANLFAKDTIDESVYRLLHDKLRMFELLFGQITTILGEIDDDKDAGTFEAQVMTAVMEPSDAAMQRRMDALGKKAEVAYERAQVQGGDHTASNAWIADTSHRKGLTKAGSRDLTPKVVKQDRERRTAVEIFVRDYLAQVGGTITWEAKGTKSRPGFLSAQLPDEAAAALGDRSELHLAFGGEALENHAEAELCAVGTEVFEQIVESLADRGDLVALVPDERWAETTTPWMKAAPDVRFIERRFAEPAAWQSEIVWRVRNVTEQAGEDLHTTFHAAEEEPYETAWHRELRSGDELPVTKVDQLVSDLVAASVPGLTEIVDAIQERVDVATAEEHNRLTAYYEDRIEELRVDRGRTQAHARRRELDETIARLERAEKEALRQSTAAAEVQADALALHLTASPEVTVVERWETAQGEPFELRYLWDITTEHPTSFEGEDGEAVEVVARCRSGHLIDHSRIRICDDCTRGSCPSCKTGVSYQSCLICGSELCHECLTGRLCAGCNEPTIEAGRPAPVEIGLGHGSRLVLDHHKAILERASGETVEWLSDIGVEVSHSQGLHTLMHTLGTCFGLQRAEDLTANVPDDEIMLDESWLTYLWADPDGGPSVESSALALLGLAKSSNAPEADTTPAPIRRWLERVAMSAQLEPGPCVTVGRTHVVRSIAVTDGELVLRRREARPDGTGDLMDKGFDLHQDDGSWSMVCGTTALPVERSHRSFIVTAPTRLVLTASPEDDGVTEMRLGQVASAAGSPGALVGLSRSTPDPRVAEGSPDTQLALREVERVLVKSADTVDHIVTDLEHPTIWDPDLEEIEVLAVAAATTHHRLESAIAPPERVALGYGHRVTEIWRSTAGEALIERLVPPGDPGLPRLDDTQVPASRFSVDAAGHLHEVDAHWTCGSCHLRRCRGCEDDGALDSCPVCDQLACGSCRTTRDGEGQITAQCSVCGVAACTACGHSPELRDAYGLTMCQECAEPGVDAVRDLDQIVVALGNEAQAVVTPHRVRIIRSSGSEIEVLSPSLRTALSVSDFEAVSPMIGQDYGVIAGLHRSVDAPPEELTIESTLGLHWRMSSGSSMPAGTAELLPEDPFEVNPSLKTETLDDWAEALRSALRPGATPILEYDTLETAQSLALTDGAITVRTRSMTPDGHVEVLDQRADISSADDEIFLIAGDRRFPVKRIHRSFEVVVGDSRVLLTPHPAVEAATEYSAHTFTRQLGADDAVVGLAEDSPAPLLLDSTEDVQLIDRQVRSEWRRSDRPLAVPIDLRTAEDVGIAVTPPPDNIRVHPLAPAFCDYLGSRFPARPPVVFEQWHRVVETWRSPTGSAEVTHEVPPGHDAFPVLADTGEPARHFSIDSHGHLHRPGAGWTCSACGLAHCKGCGPDRMLGDCLVCGQEACATCRPASASAGEVTRSCAVCSVADCTGCGRAVEMAACLMCDRTCCPACAPDSVCRTCISMRPLTREEQEALPAQLVAASGVQAYGSLDGDAMIVAIRGAVRCEVAVIRPEGIVSWRSAGTAAPDELPIILSVGLELGGFGNLHVELIDVPAIEPAAQSHLIDQSTEERLVLKVAGGAPTEVTRDLGSHTGSGAPVLGAITERLGAEAIRLPAVLENNGAQTLRDLVPVAATQTPPGAIKVLLTRKIQQVTVQADGLVVESGYDHDLATSTTRWASAPPAGVQPEVDQLLADLELHDAQLIWSAHSNGFGAGLALAGPYPLMICATPATTIVERLDDALGHPDRAALASWLQTGHDQVEISGYVSPDDHPQARIPGGARIERTWIPVVVSSSGAADPDAEARLLQACPEKPPPALQRTSAWIPRSHPLKDSLISILDQAVPRNTKVIEVGYRCEEVWLVGDTRVRLAYERGVGDPLPRIDASPNELVGPVVYLDRSGHLADRVDTCRYCQSTTCVSCEDRVTSCRLCAIDVCGRCASDQGHLCQACAALTKVGLLARRRLPSKPRTAASGKDTVHQVVVLPAARGEVTIIESTGTDAMTTVTKPLAPEILAHLDRLTGTSEYSNPTR